jgi:uncharacterized coiled-coil protein SlyX
MENKKIAKELFGILNGLTETQKHQSNVLDKLAEGLARAVGIIDSMQQRVNKLEERVKTLEKGGRE